GPAMVMKEWCGYLKIRFRCGWNLSVVFGAVFIWVFGADILRPSDRGLPIGHGRGPWRGEHVWVFNREGELEVLTPVREIDGGRLRQSILLRRPIQSVFRRGVIQEPIALDDVQRRSLR